MKPLTKFYCLLLLIVSGFGSYAQSPPRTFLETYTSAGTGREKGEAIINYIGNNNDSLKDKSLFLLSYFEQNNDRIGKDYTHLIVSMLQNNTGDFASTLKESFDALKRFENNNDTYGQMWAFAAIANSYAVSKNYDKAIYYYKKESETSRLLNDSVRYINTINNIAYTYVLANLPDSGIIYAQQAVDLSYRYHYKSFLAYAMSTLGENYMVKHDYEKALPIIKESYAQLRNDAFATAGVLNDLVECFAAMSEKDSLFYYAHLSINISKKNAFNNELLKTYESLYKFFDKVNYPDSSNKYFRLATVIKDSLYNIEKIKLIQDVTFNQQLHEQEEKGRKLALKNKIKLYAVLAAAIAFLIILIILYQNNKQKQKANQLLQQQKQDIETQRDETRKVLDELTATQAQLIQSEKMASLGELTAGIAHEIQNPLNFVNNFSELNKELLEEAAEEISKGNLAEAETILTDIKDNEEKINHHGKRADAIVKGMLQHSRKNSGLKEPTDINALCDEYLRLSYHGLRAKDKHFNANFITEFDTRIGLINIIPQDMGRVLLNLFNNAFYATSKSPSSKGEKYKPFVSVTTRKSKVPNSNAAKSSSLGAELDGVEIVVKDNGSGILSHLIDKIFQPFFTTKPTGEGTGLGLYLSYDIIKAHGGQISVRSEVNEGTEFTILLPS